MAGYSTRVRRDIARWLDKGLIDAALAERLASDVDENERRSLSFGAVLSMMAALLFAAAILIFVAANWEAIPRLGRVAGLFVLILGGYVGGALAKARGHGFIGEALWIVAVAAFGGAIALIGQMYHLAGSEASALVTWGAGTALAALALRSGPLTVAAVGIADAWLVLSLTGSFDIFFRSIHVPSAFVAALLVLFGLSLWTRSQPARHLILLSLIFYGAALAVDRDAAGLSTLMAAVCAGVFAVAVLAPGPVDRMVQVGGRLPLHALIGFLTAMAIIQIELVNGPGFAVAAAVTLAGIALAIVFGGRVSRGLRWLAYIGFAFELCLIYAVTMETMLGTAGFFLAAAVTLAILAFIIVRVEKHMKRSSAEGAAP
ncbi:DUF2157 domain-containing protein [Aquamicrobium soli]|jgi:uncharacterized membrane protein|uniref:DUF2157 domain-containing protein n=1 Tax=Aquamicrobium soli TaxID=1811518 RepID=A0ABV7KDH6_9HYPH